MTNKPGEMQADIPEVIRDPSKGNTCYERGRFLGKVNSYPSGSFVDFKINSFSL